MRPDPLRQPDFGYVMRRVYGPKTRGPKKRERPRKEEVELEEK